MYKLYFFQVLSPCSLLQNIEYSTLWVYTVGPLWLSNLHILIIVCMWAFGFNYFWLCWVFTAACGLSLVAASGATLCCGVQASHCGGFFLLQSTGSRAWATVLAAHGL